MTSRCTIHVIDDDDAMRHSLAALLEEAGHRVETYTSAEDFLTRASMASPACIVCDVRMPGMDGLGLLREIESRKTGVPMILVTGHGDVPLAVTAMKAGAADFLEKPFEADALLSAIEKESERCLSSNEAPEVLTDAHTRLALLTAREREVLERLVAGESNKEAAKKLGVSHRTVEFHRAHIIEKTGARGLPDLVRLWIATHAAAEPARSPSPRA